jgi:alpha-tubulin suppressor-like RCC1 family protein
LTGIERVRWRVLARNVTTLVAFTAFVCLAGCSNSKGGETEGDSGAGDGSTAGDSGEERSMATAVSVESESASSVCAVSTKGGVSCWGELGNGAVDGFDIPVQVKGLTSDVTAVSVGLGWACVVTEDGGVQCWGDNLGSSLGNGSTASSSIPVQVTGLTSGVTGLSVGESSACAVTKGGGVVCWGMNERDQLGNGSIVSSTAVPVQVTGLTSEVTAVSVGLESACAVTEGGGVQCWGDVLFGSLGNGSTAGSSIPVQVTGLTSGVTAVAVGADSACALTKTGGVQCWGASEVLGSESDAGVSSVPVQVTGLTSGVKAISVGGLSVCVVTEEGGVKCWGAGAGVAGPVGSVIPVQVPGLTSGVKAVSVGGESACAVTESGGVKCWGSNVFGQLGNGSEPGSELEVVETPVTVTGF